MIYYENENSVVMTPPAFKKLFGLTYSEFQKRDSDEAMIARKIKFADAHCSIDPYDSDILQEINPIIRDSFVELDQACKDAAAEI